MLLLFSVEVMATERVFTHTKTTSTSCHIQGKSIPRSQLHVAIGPALTLKVVSFHTGQRMLGMFFITSR